MSKWGKDKKQTEESGKEVPYMRIVIVEDEAPIREGIAKILQKINPDYELEGTAADGQEGYALICRTKPELIIMDIEMPKMNGLEMLARLREEGYQCKVLILSAYSDFNYAKQAIELNIENYLLKPIKIRELKKALQQVEDSLVKEQNREKAFSIEGIFLSCLNGQIKPDEQFHSMTRERFGFALEEPAEVFAIWLGDGYEEQKKRAKELLEDVGAHTVKFASYVIEADAWKMLIMILYRLDGSSQYTYFQKSVSPMLCSNLNSPIVLLWRHVDNLLELSTVMEEMQQDREWNLLLGKGFLIRRRDVENIKTVPLKHPTELEDQACQAVKRLDRETVSRCFKALFQYYQEVQHTPEEVKKSLIRFTWSMINAYKEVNEIDVDLQIQGILREISEAISWNQIDASLHKLFDLINEENKKEELPVSVLVQKAQQMIRKYYDQGITLDEIANKLFVSEEYLSAQFKKETGATFSETIRKYRIEKVKELLLNTHLKLNQIAELAGYSDPKYMSRVFKEEVGMLPNEFRKSAH
ncbi:MAG: response regulator [Faecalicatena sp.]|uniref:response regulator n=1 Tax=Faecalicatena sp. TaxID=2005360 RepID=UPI00258371D9|nr:response regulator [Faecalicatena sp.]MCI6466281.1 response regulator [Faecalicatena sp.]MDY5617723.1 response regulator [Lachnospiraceae bacterium]